MHTACRVGFADRGARLHARMHVWFGVIWFLVWPHSSLGQMQQSGLWHTRTCMRVVVKLKPMHPKVQNKLTYLLAPRLLLYDTGQGVHRVVQGKGRLSKAGAVCWQVRHNHPAGGATHGGAGASQGKPVAAVMAVAPQLQAH